MPDENAFIATESQAFVAIVMHIKIGMAAVDEKETRVTEPPKIVGVGIAVMLGDIGVLWAAKKMPADKVAFGDQMLVAQIRALSGIGQGKVNGMNLASGQLVSDAQCGGAVIGADLKDYFWAGGDQKRQECPGLLIGQGAVLVW